MNLVYHVLIHSQGILFFHFPCFLFAKLFLMEDTYEADKVLKDKLISLVVDSKDLTGIILHDRVLQCYLRLLIRIMADFNSKVSG